MKTNNSKIVKNSFLIILAFALTTLSIPQYSSLKAIENENKNYSFDEDIYPIINDVVISEEKEPDISKLGSEKNIQKEDELKKTLFTDYNLPESTELEGSDGVYYDVQTKKVISLKSEENKINEDPETTITSNPDYNLNSFTDLELVNNPSSHPARMNVKLFVTFASGTSECSGALIDSKHVITAGHCVYDEANNLGWAQSIKVIPAYNYNDWAFGNSQVLGYYTPSQWFDNQLPGYDYGVLNLSRPVGALTGWYGIGYNNNSSFFTGNTFNNYSFPADPPTYNGNRMYYSKGQFDSVSENLLVLNNHFMETGQSGSSASNNNIVYGIASRVNTQTYAAQYVRLTGSKITNINSNIINHIPSSPDLIPLDVNVSPATINAGQKLSSINYLIHNYSSSTWQGPLDVEVYLSTDSFISTNDTLLQTRSLEALIDPRSSIRITSNDAPVIPSNITGNYRIGIILKANDYSISNNATSGWDPGFVTVTNGGSTDPTPSPTPTPFQCLPPSSGDWILSQSCTYTSNAIAYGDVIIRNNSILTIENGAQLNIDLLNRKLKVENGSGVLVKNGGKIY